MIETGLCFRQAKPGDLRGVLTLLANDQLGQTREATGADVPKVYQDAFRAIEEDPNHLLMVVEDGAALIGTFQLSFIPGLARRGAWRGQIEAVRVADSHRGRGIGHQMMEWAIETCRARGCALVQLTSDKTRDDAQRFYTDLGFAASHEGYKLIL
ncbi:MAG: GNAT family N-acetyltransferase [Pseudomonadota bacterium]